MKSDINILFLGGAKRVSLAELFIKNGISLGIKINIFSYELDAYLPIAEVGQVIIGKRWADPDLFSHLCGVIEEYNIDIVLPFVDPSIKICADLINYLPNLFAPVSSSDVATIFFHKARADEWFHVNNIPRPVNQNRFPLIAKPVTGSASKGLIIIQSQDQLEQFQKIDNQADYLVQQFIKGEEFSVDCYVDKNGCEVSIVPRRRLEVTSGESTKTVTDNNLQVIALSRKIIDTGVFRGPITIQFIQDETTGIVYVMEINPRFGGAVLCSIAAGADSTLWILQEFMGIPIAPLSSWKEGVIMTRSFREYYFYANSH